MLLTVTESPTVPQEVDSARLADENATEPENVTYELRVEITGGGNARVSVTASYPARSASGAERAAAGNLTVTWFDGDDRVQRVFERTADDEDELRGETGRVWYADQAWDRTPQTPEHGWIFVRYSVGWNDFLGSTDDRVVVGDAYAAVLEEGDVLAVVVPSEVSPATVRGDPKVDTSKSRELRYEWTIDDEMSPKLVLDRSALTTTPNAATQPRNVTYTVVVYPTAGRVVVRAEYTTYSSVEAARAENGTLDTSWFDGDERIRDAFAARKNDELVGSSNLTTRAVFPEAEYTDVIVEVEFEWRGVFGPDEKREVIGPRIADAFRPGDRLVVEVFEWKPEAVNTDAEPTSHPGNVRYEWTISESDEPPRIVFNRSVVDDDGGSPTGTPLGPAGGILPALVALLFLVWLLARG